MNQHGWRILSVSIIFFSFMFQPVGFSEGDPLADQALVVKVASVIEKFQSHREAVIQEYQQKLEAIQKEQDEEIHKTLSPAEWARYQAMTTGENN